MVLLKLDYFRKFSREKVVFVPEPLSYCGDLVRENDPDRFLLSMFVPADRREALWALFAFNYEISKTREVVSETMLGQIRLQWWRDALAKIYDDGEVLDHEVLKPLAEAIRTYHLPREELDGLIYAREFDLEDVIPTHLEGLLIYLDHTSVPLMNLVLRVMGDDPLDELVQPVAMNYAMAGILRAVPYHAQQRRCYLPQELLDQYSVRPSWLYDIKPQDGLADVVRAVADEFVSGLKPKSIFLRKSNKLAQMYMMQLKKCGYNPLDPRLSRPPAFKELRLLFG